MAAPSYTTDLTTLTTASNVNNWDESSNASWDDAGAMVAETNFYIQNTECISAQFTKDGQGTIIYGHSSAVTVPTDGAVLFWHYWASPPSLSTLAAGGVKMLIGNGFGTFKAWDCSGSDFEPAPLGGWYNYAVDPAQTADDTVGSPATPYDYFGAAVNATAQARGNPHAVDAIRYGRCEGRYSGGESADYATFAGFAALDDASANKWALLSSIPGVPSGYRWQGLITLGYGSAVDFRDANKNIFAANVLNVSTDFNLIQVRQATSNVEWTSINITAAGTRSLGRFECVDDATVVKNSCTFTDMDIFTYKSNSEINSSTYRRCGLVQQYGASFNGCTFDDSTYLWAVQVDDLALMSKCHFASGGTGHAVSLGTFADDDSVTWDCTDTGYASTDGSTGNETIRIDVASGKHLTINRTASSSTPTVRNIGSGTFSVVQAVTLTIEAVVSLVGAEIRIYDLDNSPTGSLGTELSGVESHTSSTYIYAGAGGNLIYLQIMLDGYEEFGQQLTMPSTDGTFTALLKADLNT